MQPDNQKILDQLKRITESEQFSRSNVNIALITLLVHATLKGEKLKEITIGAEIFGNNYDPVKNDNKVRVYIHNLRKKVDEYYATSGRADEIIFRIEKGQYQVSFEPRPNQLKLLSKRKGLAVPAFIILALFVYLSVSLFKTGPPEFWVGFGLKTFPTTVLIGDHFTIEAPVPSGGVGIFRDFAINSEQDFAGHIRQHPEQASEMIPNRYPYITKMGPYCSKMLSSFFFRQHIPFDLLLNSEWDKSKINAENIVYVGQFKTMGFLKNIFTNHHSRIEIERGTIKRTDPTSGETIIYMSNSGNQMIDYTVVSRMKGPNGNEVAMFISDNDIGVISAVSYFTNTDSVSTFYQRHKVPETGFTALFKVSGWERTGYQMELVSIDF
jgi:hypothetical protein